MLLLKTVHGSHLYGMDHAGSDHDFWEVYSNKIPSPSKYSKQTIRDNVDLVQTNLSTFMNQANKGVPQALECMFSDKAEVDEITDLRRHYRVDTGKFFVCYQKTIKAARKDGGTKKLRHAVRLSMNLQQGLIYGRFQPTLNSRTVERLFNSTDEELERWADQILENL